MNVGVLIQLIAQVYAITPKTMFLFTIIDNHTKYAWAIPLKGISGKSTTTAFKKLIEKEMRKPQKVWRYRSKEFYNTAFLNFLKEQKIQIYSTNSDLKAVFVELFNRTLLDSIKNQCTFKVKIPG